jgi:regulatory protein
METQPHKKRTTPKPPKKITETYLYNAGLHYLKRYTASTPHFQYIMMRKIKKSCAHHTDQDLETCKNLLIKTTEKLTEQGFLNDNQYTHGMITSYRKRGVSKKAIHAKLSQKGLSAELISETLEKIDTYAIENYKDPELDAALTHARKKRLGPFSRIKSLSEKDIQRALGSFARAGFSFDIAKHIMTMQNISPNQ